MGDDATTERAATKWAWHVVNYAGPADQGKAISWVRCAVEGHTGVEVLLAAELPPGETGGGPALTLTALTGSRPEFGPYACELGPVKAGYYTIAVAGIEAPLRLWLDGSASAAVTLVPGVSSVPIEHPTPHLFLLGQIMTNQANFLALTRYVARFGAVVTFDLQQALLAQHAILVGSPQLVSEAIETQLRAAGVRVERVQGDIAAQLDRAVSADSPFISD